MQMSSHCGADMKSTIIETYAKICTDDKYSDSEKPVMVSANNLCKEYDEKNNFWISPSDLLIDIVALIPPLTSKLTRGQTHEGIFSIGDELLKNENAYFENRLKKLINDNDECWTQILNNEILLVNDKVKNIYNDIFKNKSRIFIQEINSFYEKSLQQLEIHVKNEIKNTTVSICAEVISHLNVFIQQKLAEEEKKLRHILHNKFIKQVLKIKNYYKLLLNNELQKNNRLISAALCQKNNAITAFIRQIEAENITSSMYVMCTERKKCKINKINLEHYLTTDISEKIEMIKNRQYILNSYKENDVEIIDLDKSWEEKIKKVLKLLLKFICFSLKLLPEQSTFLLDFEKMGVLQLTDIQKQPKAPSILVNEEELSNVFVFEKSTSESEMCKKEPFLIKGNQNDPTPPRYGSTETFSSDIDLQYFRVQREFIYAKCHNFDEIKKFLESQKCHCHCYTTESPIQASITNTKSETCSLENERISSNESLVVDDIKAIRDCPGRYCQDWFKNCTFPFMPSYLNFTEENYKRVKTIVGSKIDSQIESLSKYVSPIYMFDDELPFSESKEQHTTIGTQYSSQEDLCNSDIKCSCLNNQTQKKSISNITETSSHIQELLNKRKASLKNILQENPNLLQFFTDESFNFIL